MPAVFWDPMYKRTYNVLSEMALYDVMDNEATIDGVTYHPTEPNVPAAPGRTGTWFKESPPGQYAGPSPSMPF